MTVRQPNEEMRDRELPPRLITALREALDGDETLERLRRVAIEPLEAGDPAFWKMLLDRVWARARRGHER